MWSAIELASFAQYATSSQTQVASRPCSRRTKKQLHVFYCASLLCDDTVAYSLLDYKWVGLEVVPTSAEEGCSNLVPVMASTYLRSGLYIRLYPQPFDQVHIGVESVPCPLS